MAFLPNLSALAGSGVTLDGSTLSLDRSRKPKGVGAPSRPFVPFMQILYHGDLSRVGEQTPKDAFGSGAWVGLGRLDPVFQDRKKDVRRPLADPYISRGQAAIRWNAAQSCFDLKPSPSARLPVSRVDLKRGGKAPIRETLTQTTALPPGSLIDIGGRILLLLQHRPWRAPDEDRLGMVGESSEVWALRQIITDVAGFDRSALILGDTGVGKELVARALHDQSPRAKGPFVATNCAALPEQLIESLLFGHKKGAFTGATADSTGLFIAAEGGTLFLDELGEMPMGPQAKLLRVLEEKVVVPLGSKRGIPIDVRVVAATNRVPDNAIEKGLLRSDLYYRLASHILKVPSIYQRFLDAPEIFVHFLSQNLDPKPSLSWLWSAPPEANLPIPMDFFLRLLRHQWRGNVREIKNLADQTALLNLRPGTFQMPEGIGEEVLESQPSPSRPTAFRAVEAPVEDESDELEVLLRATQKLGLKRKTARRLLDLSPLPDLGDTLRTDAGAEALREHLAQSLYLLMEREDFNQTHVASALGVSRSTLISLLKRFGLPRAQDLSHEDILTAHRVTGGDSVAMARVLRVSTSSLKLRLKQDPPPELQG